MPLQCGGNQIMAELVSGAIQVTVQNDYNGPFQLFRINPKRSLKKMSNKFMAMYAKEDEIL